MSNVVCDYFEPIQDQLEEARIAAEKHAKKESVRIKTKAEIAKQESDLEWMKGIIERVNGLINF